MASELGFVDGPQESRREERSQKRQTVVVQGRRQCGHPGVGNIHGATLLLPEAGVHSLTPTCFLTSDVGAAGVTSPSGSEQP